MESNGMVINHKQSKGRLNEGPECRFHIKECICCVSDTAATHPEKNPDLKRSR